MRNILKDSLPQSVKMPGILFFDMHRTLSRLTKSALENGNDAVPVLQGL
jgi:hypothetical protein